MCTSNNNTEAIFALTYKFLRYANATLPSRYRININIEEATPLYLKQYIEELFKNSRVLGNNFNLARLFYGFDYIIYGGITPFISRLSS